MAQFLRPDGNITQTNFTGGFADIDEVTPSNTDFAYSGNNQNGTLEVSLSNPASGTPGSGTVTVRYRSAQIDSDEAGGPIVSGSGNAASLTAYLYQGGTLISTGPTESAEGAWTDNSWSLTTGEAASITDWNDLRIRVSTSGSGGAPASRRGYGISWAEVETPDPVLPDELTAQELTSGTPVVDNATITEDVVHHLTSQEVTAGAPVLDNATLTTAPITIELTAHEMLTRRPLLSSDSTPGLNVVSGTTQAGQIYGYETTTSRDVDVFQTYIGQGWVYIFVVTFVQRPGQTVNETFSVQGPGPTYPTITKVLDRTLITHGDGTTVRMLWGAFTPTVAGTHTTSITTTTSDGQTTGAYVLAHIYIRGSDQLLFTGTSTVTPTTGTTDASNPTLTFSGDFKSTSNSFQILAIGNDATVTPVSISNTGFTNTGGSANSSSLDIDLYYRLFRRSTTVPGENPVNPIASISSVFEHWTLDGIELVGTTGPTLEQYAELTAQSVTAGAPVLDNATLTTAPITIELTAHEMFARRPLLSSDSTPDLIYIASATNSGGSAGTSQTFKDVDVAAASIARSDTYVSFFIVAQPPGQTMALTFSVAGPATTSPTCTTVFDSTLFTHGDGTTVRAVLSAFTPTVAGSHRITASWSTSDSQNTGPYKYGQFAINGSNVDLLFTGEVATTSGTTNATDPTFSFSGDIGTSNHIDIVAVGNDATVSPSLSVNSGYGFLAIQSSQNSTYYDVDLYSAIYRQTSVSGGTNFTPFSSITNVFEQWRISSIELVGTTGPTLGLGTTHELTAQSVTSGTPVLDNATIEETSSGRTATLAVTLDSATASGSAELDIAGTASATLGAVTVSSAAELDVSGSLSAALGDVSLSADADVVIDGSLSVSLDALTGSGAADLVITGTSAPSLDAATGSGTSELDIAAIGAATLSALTVASSAELDVSGSLSVTLGDVSGAGVAELDIASTLAVTLDDATLSAIGNSLIYTEGSLAVTLDDAVATTTAELDLSATLASTLDAVTSSATGELDLSASLSATLDAATAAGLSELDIEGTLSASLDAATAAGESDLPIEGTQAGQLADVALSAQSDLIIDGTATLTLGALTGSGTAEIDIAASADVTLGNVSSSSTSELDISGTLSATLADATVFAEGVSIAVTVGSLAATLDNATGAGTAELDIAATTAVTLQDASASGSAGVDIAATASVTLADVVASGTALIDIAGTAAPTLDDVTGAGSAEIDIAATAAVTLEDVALSASGQLTATTVGVLSITLDAATAAGSASLAIEAQGAATLADLAAAGTSELDIAATLTTTLADLTLAATGTKQDVALGTAAITLDDATLAAVGEIDAAAVGTAVLDDATLSASADVRISGDAGVTLDGTIASGQGALAINATTTVTLETLTGYGFIAPEILASAAVTLDDLAGTGESTIRPPEYYRGKLVRAGGSASTVRSMGGSVRSGVSIGARILTAIGIKGRTP